MKYAWIERHKNRWPVTLQCEVLNVSASGYFEQRLRKDSDLEAVSGKRLCDAALLVHIRAVHAASKGDTAGRESARNCVPMACGCGKNGSGGS